MILISGACGFVGSTLIRGWLESGKHKIVGFDNLDRPGSELNRLAFKRAGIPIHHGDVRCSSDFEVLPQVDVVIEAAANPSVLAGADGRISSRQVVEHNLFGTVNTLEYCRRHKGIFILLSTSRVYSIPPLARLSVRVCDGAFEPNVDQPLPAGLTLAGVREDFSTAPRYRSMEQRRLRVNSLRWNTGWHMGFPSGLIGAGCLRVPGSSGDRIRVSSRIG